MNKEINKIINWIETGYTRLNYKEELLLVNYIKQLQQENKQLKEYFTNITNYYPIDDNPLLGKFVITIDGHSGVVIKQFKPTGRSITIHIKENDGRIWYCPISDVIKVGDSNE